MPGDSNDETRSHVILTQGTSVAHYRIISKIGAGGMGEVYLAEDTKLKRRVALKFLPTHLATNEIVHTRFVREAQTLARLSHPNIVGVHEVSEFDGRPFYAMELIEGESLHHFAHDNPLPTDELIDYAIQMCQGLGEAHRAGIVHRDIKSANIALDKNNRIRLLDFGLATHEGDDKITKTGSTLGTVSYMSPEQVSGREVDNRSDLFSLGVVLYELIAGRTPFRRDSEGATLNAIMQDTPEPLSRYKSGVPEKLQNVVMKLLEKDKELRYQSAEGVIADLKRLMYDSQQTAQARVRKPESSSRSRWIGAAAAVVLLVVAGMWFFGPKAIVPESEASVPMIAVLPFENLGSADDEYFADGITDEITSRLAGITGLGVISRTSAMKYKNTEKSLRQIGAELGVDYVLDGTVRWSKVGENVTVRITPQLIRVADDRPLWSDNYQRDLLEVFAVQADIAAKIVGQLDIALLPRDRDVLDSRPTDNPEAYALYLKALALYGRPTRIDLKEPYAKEDAIDSAIALDPNFVLAHALRSEIQTFRAFQFQDTTAGRRAKESADRALELEPGLARGHIALGMYYNLVEENYDAALKQFTLARSEVHNDPDLFRGIALVQLRQGRFAEAAANCRRAAELDPLNPERHWQLSEVSRFGRAYDEASRAIDRAIRLEPSYPPYWEARLLLVGYSSGDRTRMAELAREALQTCDTLDILPLVAPLADAMPDIPWEHLVQELRDKGDPTNAPRYFAMVAMTLYQLGDSVTARLYADSARHLLEIEVQNRPDDFHATTRLGLIYAFLGDCESAIEYGKRAVDLMPIDVCHW